MYINTWWLVPQLSLGPIRAFAESEAVHEAFPTEYLQDVDKKE
jgi:hypothetical protein